MKSVTLTTETGYSWTTDVNGSCSDESICRYFLGERFNCAAWPNEEMEVCVKCVIDGRSYELTPA